MKHVQGLAARLRHFSPSNMLLRPTISWGFAPRRERERRQALPRALQKVLTFSYRILRYVDIDPCIF
jgi:hypothetical protein